MIRGLLVRLAAVSVVAALLASCDSGTPEEHIARGRALADKGDHAGAIVELKNALQARPKSAEGRFLLGRELLVTGNPRAAEIELTRAYDGRYDRDAVVPALVKSLVLTGQVDRIPPRIATTELTTPAANAELQSLLGDGAASQSRLDDALRAYRSAQQYLPDYAPALLGEARIRAIRGDLDGASSEVATVLAQDPKNVDALVIKGDIAQTRGAMPDAVAAYLEAVQANGRNVPARENLASAYVATNQRALAEEQLAVLKKIAPRDPGVSFLDALIAFGKKDLLHANDAIAASIAANPNNGAAQILSGAISLAMNQPTQAELHLIEGVRLSQGSVYARRLLAGLYVRQRLPQKAYDILEPAVRAYPDDPTLLGTAGEIALQQGDYPRAATLFDRASQADPDNGNLRVRGAAVALARGDETRAFDALEAAAKTSTTNPAPDIALVIARLNRKQYDEALAAWQDLEKRQPDNPITYNLRAAIDLGRKDVPAARTALEHALRIQPTFFPAAANLAGLDEAEGNLDSARQRYRTLIEKDKGNIAAMLSLADLEARHGGRSDDVVALLKEARRANPLSEQPVTALVAYYLGQRQPSSAYAVAQEALVASPNNIFYQSLVGDLELERGSVDQALGIFRQLVQQRPDVARFQLRLGQAMVLANQAGQAVPVFANAIAKDPNDAAQQVAAVAALLSAEKVDDANRLLAEIRKTAPKSPALVELDGDVKMAGAKYADAAATYRRALALTPSSALAVKTATALRLAGNGANAGTFVAEWVKAHPDDVAVRMADADAALQAKDYARAAQGYRAVLARTPNDALATNNLAWTLWQTNDGDALATAERAGTLAPDSPVVNDTLGWILVEKGDVKRGIALLQKAAAAAPGQREIALHLAKAQIKDGRKDDARSTLQALVKAAPASAEAKESKTLMATL